MTTAAAKFCVRLPFKVCHQLKRTCVVLFQVQLSGIQAAAESVAALQDQLATKLSADTQASAAALEDAVARLQLELSSGGNIRLEEARADEPWLASCQELLRSRLVQAGEPGGVHGITDVQVIWGEVSHTCIVQQTCALQQRGALCWRP
jgi:hypothetical protein